VAGLDLAAEFSAQRLIENDEGGGRSSGSRMLEIANLPRDAYDGPIHFEVSSQVYQQTMINDPVCIQIHPGALRMRWMTHQRCPPSQVISN